MSKFIQTTVRAKNKVGVILVAILAGMILMASGASSPRNSHALPVQTLAQAERITALNVTRQGQSETTLGDGRILIVGGRNALGNVLATGEIYDSATKTGSARSTMVTARADHSATLLPDGRVLIAGGRDPKAKFASTEIYDPATATFSTGPSMHASRSGHSATLLRDGRVIIAGGDAGGSIEIFSPKTNTFSTVTARLSSPRLGHSAILLGGQRISFIGGTTPNGNSVHSGETLNLDTSSSATVSTDKADYQPGDTVLITGSGWTPSEPVALHIERSNNSALWDSSAIPDGEGNFSNFEFVIQPHDIGVVFTLTATQLDVTATTQFTDVVGAGYAPNGDPGDFEIQGNVIATAGGGHTDWVANGVGTTGLLTNAGVPLDSSVTSRRLDGYGGSGDDVFAGSSKTSDNPNTYTWKTAGANNKCDMNNSYVHISKDGNNDRWITASADRSSNNGTAYVDFELSQATLSQVTDAGCSSAPCGHFETSPAGKNPGDPLYSTGGRTPNDLMVTAQYNSGGALASILIYQWKAVSGTYQWVDVTSSIPNNAAFVATNVVDGVAVPYGAFSATSYSKNQFVETSVNLTKLIAAAVDPCLGIEVKTVFVKTKTSTATTATLEDFVTPISVSFSAGFMVDLAQSPVSCFGGSNGSVTVTVSGGTAPYMVTLGGVTQTIVNSGGSTTFTSLMAGSKSVHVVATGGCSRDGTIEVTQPAAALSASISSQTNIACFGASTGSVTVAGSGGTSPYTYSIDGTNFGGSGTFNNLAAGSYTVTVKDANGCTTAQPVTITQPVAALSASISSQTNVACFGASTGSVTVAGSGGTSPFTYSIDGTNFGGSGTFNNLAAGSYAVTVKDANGCTTAQPVTITQPAAALSASISSQTNVACFGASTGSVTVAGSSGTSPYTYSIDGVNFGGSGTFNNLAAGSYTVTVKDANGCTTAQPVTITQPAAALSASISSQTNVACFGASTGNVTVAGSSGTSPYTYSIDGVNFGGSGTFNNLVAGSYTVTVKDANGCTTAQPVAITQPVAALSASISSQTNVACFGASTGSVTVAGSGGTSPYTYSIDGVNFGGNGTFNNLTAGSYTVTVKDANGCTTAQPVTITQPASALSASISAQTNVACFGASTGSVTVAGSGGTSPFTYSIDGVHFGGSGTFNNLVAGSYTVTVKDANGCTTAQPVTITQPAAALSASIGAQTNVACFGASTGSVTVAGSNGTSPYTYSIDGVHFGGSGTFNNLTAGSYTVTVKDANGCTTAQPVTITQPASALSASISAQTNVACFGASTGSVTVAGSGGTSPFTYSIDGVHFGGSGTFNNLVAGSYTVTVKDANGCTTAQPVTITQPASALSASISAQTNVACFGASTGSVTVAGSGGTSPYTYSIDGVHFGGSGTFNNLTAGSYTVTVKDANGCTTAQPVTITQPASALSASISAQTNVACFGASTGSATVAGSGGTSPYTYSIDGTNFGGSGTFNNLVAGSYTVTVKDANGCTTAQPVTITQPAAALSASISAQTNVACFGASTGSVTVAGSGGTSPYTYSIDGVHFGGSGTFNNLTAGSYAVTVKDANGCTTPQPVTITQPAAALSASISAQTNLACHGASTGSVTVAGSGGTSPYTYSIDGVHFGGSGTFNNLAAGSYTVTVKDANSCTTAQPVTITQPASALSASISAQTNVACFGASTGSVTVAGSGGTSPYTYSIDGTNFGVSGTFNNLAAGSYTVTVKDANGCTTAQPVTITQPASALSTTSTETDPICSTGLGSMTVTFSGGTPGYQCKLDSGLFTACTSPATFNNLSAGSHTVSVRDSKGCLGPEQIKTVTIPPAITASATGSGCSPGTITVTASGGTGTLTYSLDGISFQGSNVFSDLAAGQYVVTVKDANGCTKITNTVTIRGSITITANDRTKTYGTSLTLGTTEFAVTGSLAPGEHITSVTLTSLTGAAGNASMPVGTYTNEIVPSNATGTGGFLASNYCITYNSGTLVVNKAVLTVKADDKFKVYDGAPFTAFTSKITGFVNGETEAGLRSSGGLSGAPDYVGSAIGAINPASYTITPVIGTLAATNYSFIFVDGILTILPAVVTPPVEIRLASVSPKTIRKGGTAVFTITMSHGPLPGPLTVNYVMSGNGTMGVHYTLSGTLGQAIIPAGSSLGTVTLTALPTNLTSGSEKITMTLIPGAGYSVVNNKKSKTVTIKNK